MSDNYDLFNKGEKPQAKNEGDAVKLSSWGVVVDLEGHPHLAGVSNGHPTLKDGENITSSAVAKVEDGFIYTVSGRKYELTGDANPDFANIIRDTKDLFAKLAEKDPLAALVFGKLFGLN